MKRKIFFVLFVVLAIQILCLPVIYAEDNTPLPTGSFGFVQNLDVNPIYVTAQRVDGTTVVIEVGGHGAAILPAQTTRVTALPTSFGVGEQVLAVTVGCHNANADLQAINNVGESVDLARSSGPIPTDYVLAPSDEGRVVIPREAYLPGQSPQGIRERDQARTEAECSAERAIDETGDPFLRKLNEDLMRYRERLSQLDPNSEEAGAIRDAFPLIEEIIRERVETENQKYGDDWLERYRDPETGELPGGLLSYERVLYEPVDLKSPDQISGRVYTRKLSEDDNWSVQRIFTHGPAVTLGPFMEWPLKISKSGEGFNVLWQVTYCELDNEKLFDKFKRLTEARVAINEKFQRDDRKISKREFKDCQELIKIREKVFSSAKWKSGSLPGWMALTDAEGKFAFNLDKLPGKGNIIFLILEVAAFPPFGEATPYFTQNQTPSVGTAEFSLVWPRTRFIPECEIPQNLLRAYPGGMDPAELERKLDEKNKQLIKEEKNLQKIQKEDRRPDTLEPRWEDRVLKNQRAFREEYVKQHGDSKEWDPETRGKFEKELVLVPDSSRGSWENEAAEYARRREETLGQAQKKLDLIKIAIKNIESGINDRDKKLDLWDNKVLDAIGDVGVMLPEDYTDSSLHLYEEGREVEGDEISPVLRQGYMTKVYLVKQVIDDVVRNKPIIGYYGNTGETSVFYDPDASGGAKPPYVFRFGENIKKHCIINDFVNTFRGSNTVGVGVVASLFDGLTTPDMLNGKLEQFFVPLPRTVEVEGYRIKNSEKFHAEVDEQLRLYRDLTDRTGQEVSKIMQDRKDGKISREEANEEYMSVTQKWSQDIQKVMVKLAEITRDNPAFK